MNEEKIELLLKTKDLYKILGLNKDSSPEEIKSSYRKLAAQVHPDRCKSLKATEAFQKVSHAYQTLSNEDRRRHYDMVGDEPPPSNHNFSNTGQTYVFRNNGYYQDIPADELFRAFFGDNIFVNTGRRYRYQRQNYYQNENNNIFESKSYLKIGLILLLLFILPLFTQTNSNLEKELSKIISFIDDNNEQSPYYYYFRSSKYRKKFSLPKTWILERNKWNKLDNKFYEKLYSIADIIYENQIKLKCKKELNDKAFLAKPSCIELKKMGFSY